MMGHFPAIWYLFILFFALVHDPTVSAKFSMPFVCQAIDKQDKQGFLLEGIQIERDILKMPMLQMVIL